MIKICVMLWVVLTVLITPASAIDAMEKQCILVSVQKMPTNSNIVLSGNEIVPLDANRAVNYILGNYTTGGQAENIANKYDILDAQMMEKLNRTFGSDNRQALLRPLLIAKIGKSVTVKLKATIAGEGMLVNYYCIATPANRLEVEFIGVE